jgi:tetratricopeptide (TPR) repeat protein
MLGYSHNDTDITLYSSSFIKMCGCNMRLKFLVPAQIALPTIIMLLASGILTLSLLFSKTGGWTNSIQNHMVSIEQNGINMTSVTLSTLTSEVFQSIDSDMRFLSKMSQAIFDGELEFNRASTPYESLGTQPPGGLNGQGMNLDYSAWFSKGGSTTYLQNATYMNDFWSATFKSNRLYQGLYLGFSDKLFVHLPYQVFSNYPTMQYLCLIDNQQVTGYDPTCRSWFILASANPNNVILTPPYLDASTGEVIVTAAKAVFSSANQFIGVIGIDISMDVLARSITDRTILSSGYPFLIVNNNEGTIVLHRQVSLDSDEVKTIFDVEPVTPAQYIDIRAVDRGQISYGDNELLTWDHVAYDSDGYNILISVPNSDIVAPTTRIRDDVHDRKGWAIAMMVSFTIIGVLIMICASYFISAKIGGDIRSLGKVFSSGNFDEETGIHYSKETRSLSDIIHLMSRITKFAYAKSLSLDESAFNLYAEVQEHMGRIDNDYGVAAAIGAKANHLVRLNDPERLEEALEYFDECIDLSEELHATRDNGEDMRYLRLVANRYMNRGVLKMNMNRWSDAEDDFGQARGLFEQIESALGVNKVAGNRGLLLLRRNKDSKAGKLLKSAYDDAKNAYESKKVRVESEAMHELGAALQYAALNYGKFLMQTGHEASSLRYFRKALTLQLTNDATLVGNCLMEIATVAERRELSNIAKEVKSYIPGARRKYRIAIDLSGSMTKTDMEDSYDNRISRIDAARGALLDVLDEMNYGDEVQIIGFSNDVHNITRGSVVIQGDNIDEIKAQVEDNTNTLRETAFYHAVNELAKATIADEASNDSQMLIVLTDGADTASHRHNVTLNAIKDKIDDNNLRIVVISVAMKDKYVAILRDLTRAEGNLLIEANDAEAISSAMKKAVRMMKGQLARETFV